MPLNMNTIGTGNGGGASDISTLNSGKKYVTNAISSSGEIDKYSSFVCESVLHLTSATTHTVYTNKTKPANVGGNTGIKIIADGIDEEVAVEQLVKLVESGFSSDQVYGK